MSTISTIAFGNPGAAYNYSDIQPWHDAFATGGWIGECYTAGGEFAEGTVAINFSGKSVTATDFITLRTATGQGFKDNVNAQTNALKYNASNGVGIKGTSTSVNFINAASYAFQEFDYLQFKAPFLGTFGNDGSTPPRPKNVGCIFENDTGGGGGIGCAAININCLVINVLGGGSVLFQGGVIECYGCTAVTPSDKSAAMNGFSSDAAGYDKLIDCASFGNTNFCNSPGTWSTTCDYNATDQSVTMPGTGGHNLTALTYGNQFQNTLVATRDFRVKSGAGLIDAGTSISSFTTVDIVGTSRPQNSIWDIGCWEFVAAGGAFNPGWAYGATRTIGMGVY